MMDKIKMTFILKDGSQVTVEKDGYWGFIFGEGFGLGDSLKVKDNKVFYKRWQDYYEFNNIDDLIKFIIDDFEVEDEVDFDNDSNYQLLKSKILKISDISEICSHIKFVDFEENGEEFYNERDDKVSFKKFTGDF